MSVIEEIAAERQRQIEAEGWSARHDDEHRPGELSRAGAAYAKAAFEANGFPPAFWPWDLGWWKPKNPRRDLIRAGALIVAEIERLDRAAKRQLADAPCDNGELPR